MTVLQLYPAPQQEMALKGLYLCRQLQRQAALGDMLIYANYIASLDGRISLPDMHGGAAGEQGVPAALANKRDWRLYQELAAQSDIMLTSARYFRQLAKGNAQDLLPVGTGEDYADLCAWRQAQGLTPQPDVAIVSASLDIPQAALEKVQDRRMLLLTTARAETAKIAALEAFGIKVMIAGEHLVEGQQLKQALLAHGYRSAYMIAGPGLHTMLVQAGVLDYLFLTTRHMLLGGDDFSTMMQENLKHAVELELLSRYLDTDGRQDFACYRFTGRAAA